MLQKIAARIGFEIDEETQEKVANEQLRMVWSHAAVGTLIATLFACVMAYQLVGVVEPRLVQIWLGLKILVAAPRVIQARIFKLRGFPGGRAWRLGTYWLLCVDGMVWGLAAFWLVRGDNATTALAIACLGCVASVATFGLQVNKVATAAYVVPIIIPMVVGLLIRGDQFGTFGAIGMSLFLTQMLITAWRSHEKLAEVFLLRIHAETVAAKSEFLSKVSHELRSPLQSIISTLDLFEINQPEQVEFARRMRRATVSLNTQLADLLTLARSESGDLVLRPRKLNVGDLLADLCEDARDVAAAKGLTLHVQFPDSPVLVYIDAVRLSQIVENLLTNAIKYTTKGSVTLQLEPFESTRRMLRFAVEDTGAGIAEDHRVTIFAPYKRAAAISHGSESSGMGLAVVGTLLGHMGGTIAVTSEVGVGSLFTVEVPAAPAGFEDSGGARVLIVDDREDVLVALSSVVNELGYSADAALSAGAASNFLSSRRYSVVLCDLQMPVRSGAELARDSRQPGGLNEQAYWIAMTAGEDIAAGQAWPFDAFVRKPISSKALKRLLGARIQVEAQT